MPKRRFRNVAVKHLKVDGVDTNALGVEGLTASAAELNILDGATVTTEELNALDGVGATAEEINTLADALADATITVGSEAADSIAVTIQLEDAAGEDLAASAALFAYISDNADGSTVASTAPDTIAIGTDGLLIELVSKKAFMLVSEADGDIDLAIGENGADTWYLALVMPNGSLVISDAITFAAP